MKKTVLGALLGAISVVLAACKPEVIADIYVGDLYEAVEESVSIPTPVVITMPIQSADECDESRNKIVPIIDRYASNEVAFRSCEVLSGEMYDQIIVETDIPITPSDSDSGVAIDGLGAVVVGEQESDPDVYKIYFVLSESFERMVSEIDDEFAFQDVDIQQVDLSVTMQNDIRGSVQFSTKGFYVNEEPQYIEHPYALARRDELRIVSSDLTATSIVLDNYVLLGHLALRDRELPARLREVDGLFSTTVWSPQ